MRKIELLRDTPLFKKLRKKGEKLVVADELAERLCTMSGADGQVYAKDLGEQRQERVEKAVSVRGRS